MAVRRNAITVLTHLILNDMVKVRGHICAMAVCLKDCDLKIVELSQLFFHELAKKVGVCLYKLCIISLCFISTTGKCSLQCTS